MPNHGTLSLELGSSFEESPALTSLAVTHESLKDIPIAATWPRMRHLTRHDRTRRLSGWFPARSKMHPLAWCCSRSPFMNDATFMANTVLADDALHMDSDELSGLVTMDVRSRADWP